MKTGLAQVAVVAAVAAAVGFVSSRFFVPEGTYQAAVQQQASPVAFPAKPDELAASPASTASGGGNVDVGGGVAAELRAVREELTKERQAREKLEREVAALSRELSGMRASTRPSESLSGAGTSPFADASTRSSDPGAVTTLTAMGFSSERAQQLKKRVDKFSLDRLTLWDSAAREGWLNSERYQAELGRINDEESRFREELGDGDYDRMLYAMGEANRVVVQEVMLGSPAASAGLQAGDMVLAYGGGRIFKVDDLRSATVQGTSGELVEVTVQRAEELQTIYVPRGPLGIRLDAERVLP